MNTVAYLLLAIVATPFLWTLFKPSFWKEAAVTRRHNRLLKEQQKEIWMKGRAGR